MEDSFTLHEKVMTVPDLTRRTILTTLGMLTTSGCIAGPPAGIPTKKPSTEQPPTDTSSPTDRTMTGNWITRGATEPNADHAVFLFNQGTRERTVRIQVIREATDVSVFDETRTVSPNAELEVYNLKQASPDGIEAFTICGQLAEPTPTPIGTPTPKAEPADTLETPDSPYDDCITMRTDACYGTAHITVDEAGELQIIYSVC